VLSDEEIEGC